MNRPPEEAAAVDPHLIGLARVSTDGQDTQLQRDALTQAGCARIFEETISTRSSDRPGLAAALDHLRPHAGDALVVWKLDRLGRSVKDVLIIADDLYERGIALRVLTGTLAGVYTPTGEGKFLLAPGDSYQASGLHPAHRRPATGARTAPRRPLTPQPIGRSATKATLPG